jgi:membrane-associated phospholipid phosphatase
LGLFNKPMAHFNYRIVPIFVLLINLAASGFAAEFPAGRRAEFPGEQELNFSPSNSPTIPDKTRLFPELAAYPGPADQSTTRRATSTGEERGPATNGWPWRRASPAEYAGTALAVGATLYSEAVYGEPGRAGWAAHNGFDEGVRNALRLENRSGRDAANTAGDVLMGTLIAAPVLDTFLTLGVRDRRWDALWQTEMINLESFTFTGLVASVMENSIRREKPFVRNCGQGRCEDDDDHNRSMPSGHEAFAFTGAGLICTHHAFQSLYADPTAERAACATSLGLAAATGVLRVMADRHYATDVLAGSLVGLFSGFVLPRLLHYSRPAAAEPRAGTPGDGAIIKQVIFSPELLGGGAALTCKVRF